MIIPCLGGAWQASRLVAYANVDISSMTPGNQNAWGLWLSDKESFTLSPSPSRVSTKLAPLVLRSPRNCCFVCRSLVQRSWKGKRDREGQWCLTALTVLDCVDPSTGNPQVNNVCMYIHIFIYLLIYLHIFEIIQSLLFTIHRDNTQGCM